MSIPIPKFSHFFVHFSEVYGTPYSHCDVDFMDGAETVCSFSGVSVMDESRNERIARILTEMSLYLGLIGELYGKQGYYKCYYSYVLRRYYSLAVRLQAITGWYAYIAILDTCNLVAPRDLGQDFS